MKMNSTYRILLTVTAACGLTLSAFAGGEDPNMTAPASAATSAPAPAAATTGLLGQKYAGLGYRYVDLDGTAGHADVYSFNFNEPLRNGIDGQLSFDWMEGSAAREFSISAGLRAYCPDLAWGKPYAEFGAGYVREKVAGVKDDSFLWSVGIGAEFQAAPAITVTPYVKYVDAPSLSGSGRWDFGVKANYWVNAQWSVTAGLDRDDDQNTGFMLGTNFRY